MEHAPQLGLFKQQSRVINATIILSLFLDQFSKYLFTVHWGWAIHCLDCRYQDVLAQWQKCVLSGHTFVFCRTTEVDKGKHDSGSQNLDPDPCLANSSAFSLPSISQCPGIQSGFTLLLVESFCKTTLTMKKSCMAIGPAVRLYHQNTYKLFYHVTASYDSARKIRKTRKLQIEKPVFWVSEYTPALVRPLSIEPSV
jgi:hypothetical protein